MVVLGVAEAAQEFEHCVLAPRHQADAEEVTVRRWQRGSGQPVRVVAACTRPSSHVRGAWQTYSRRHLEVLCEADGHYARNEAAARGAQWLAVRRETVD